MPPKKKSTCDAAIDTPDPIEFDPFNLDGHRLREEYLAIPKFTRKILEKLKQQNTTGAPKVVKDEVVENMEMLLDWMRSFALLLDQSRTFSNRLQGIEHEIRETKNELCEIRAATKDIPPAKTWAQITATNTVSTNSTSPEAIARANRRQAQEKIKKEREPYEVTLTTVNDETKQKLVTMHPETGHYASRRNHKTMPTYNRYRRNPNNRETEAEWNQQNHERHTTTM